MGEGNILRSEAQVAVQAPITPSTKKSHHSVLVTPLPIKQVASVLMIQVCESMQINVLFPFLVFMIEDFGYKGNSLGYYAGGLAASFCIAQFCSSVPWGQFSDRYGRRLAMLLGVIGTTLAVLIFGFSRTYAQAVAGRMVSGLLNGNIGVVKSFLTEITDETNRSFGFSLLSVAWGIGTVIAPMIGGLLCRPAQKYPSVFSPDGIFGEFPYLLPCLVLMVVQIITAVTVVLYLNDPKPMGGVPKLMQDVVDIVTFRGLANQKSAPNTPNAIAKPIPINNNNNSNSSKKLFAKKHNKRTYEHLSNEDDAHMHDQSSYDDPANDIEANNILSMHDQLSYPANSDDDMEPVSPLHRASHGLLEMTTTVGTSSYLPLSQTQLPTTGSVSDDDGDNSDCDTMVTASTSSSFSLHKGSLDLATTTADQQLPPVTEKHMLRDTVVLGVTLNYGVLAMAYIIWDETLPMYFKLNASEGGLSMGSGEIGLALTLGGLTLMIFTVQMLPMLERKYGKFWLMFVGTIAAIPIACVWPLLTNILINFGSMGMWTALMVLLCLKNIFSAMSYTAVMIMVNHSVTDEYLGAVNGLGQSVAALARAIGPAVGGAMWSVSVTMNFVYINFWASAVFLVGCTIITYMLPRTLERRPGAPADDEEDDDIADGTTEQSSPPPAIFH